jgi:tyrosyl-tRNA synthetase
MNFQDFPSVDQQAAYLFRGTALQGETRMRMESELRERLKLGRPLRVKLGLDPTKPFLHIGHLAPVLALKRFADLGHRTYLLLGGFTAMIGDPAGRTERRAPLKEQEVAANIEVYKSEIFRVLDPTKTIVVNNAIWFSNVRVIDFVLEVARVTLAEVLEHEDFKVRFKATKPIGLQELLYPVAQAYDSMVLCAAPSGHEDDPAAYQNALGNPEACCDVELGGNDQLFNFTLTRELMKKKGLAPQVFITTPLIHGRDAKKMGKSDTNVVRLSDTPGKIFDEIMKLDDSHIFPYLTSITDLSDDELNTINHELSKRDAKQKLAMRVVTLVHGSESAHTAQTEFENRVAGIVVPEREFVVPPELAIDPVSIVDLVYMAGLAPGEKVENSKSEAHRLVEQGGIFIDGMRAELGQMVHVKDGMILQRGQRRDARAVRLCKLE